MKSRSVVGRICCEAHQVDVVNRKKKLSERKKYQISSLSISVTMMLMEVVGSLQMKYEELDTGQLLPIL